MMGYRVLHWNKIQPTSMLNSTLVQLTPIHSQEINNTKRAIASKSFVAIGHRGCRGFVTPNSIHGFIEAIKMGVKTLHLDVVVTSDYKLVLNDSPFVTTRSSEGNLQHQPIFGLTLEELQLLEIGKTNEEGFPQQKAMICHRPTLKDVIERVEKFTQWNGMRSVSFCINVISKPEGDMLMHPSPDQFSSLLYDIIIDKGIQKRVVVQSDDTRILKVMHFIDPSISTCASVSDDFLLDQTIKVMGFNPTFVLFTMNTVSRDKVKFFHKKGIKVIVGVVNEVKEIKKLQSFGVDAILSDYPNRLIQLVI